MHEARNTYAGSRRTGPVRRLVATAALLLLTACGGGDAQSSGTAGGDGGGVASVTGQDKQPKEEAAQAERPLIRPDMTQEDEERLFRVWESCMAKNGYKRDDEYTGEVGGPKPDSATVEKWGEQYEAAQKVCAAKEPERLWERARREDPEYQDKFDKWLECAQSSGVKVGRSPEDPGILAYEDGLPAADQLKKVADCEAEAFSGK
ncbi:hypothetical protein GCM10010348_70640 [Streptomyces anthocyanicus]|uniref:hypothetical protein n=1 Tax=Streptomyces anthocyanicus TaxID=68174 RepID=UPI0018739791|nr:hypothetical protein [Streptomyces anthocyanicus]GHC33593.1 hypothetical protein GCM10010348_70640 [Streptomyces anthocyanicus]